MAINWVKIAALPPAGSELIRRDSIAKMTIKGKVLFLVNRGGQYFAGENKCPHAGAPLHTGHINETGDIVCPYHRYCFDISTGKNTSGEGYFLKTYPIAIREDGIYIGFEERSWWQRLWGGGG